MLYVHAQIQYTLTKWHITHTAQGQKQGHKLSKTKKSHKIQKDVQKTTKNTKNTLQKQG